MNNSNKLIAQTNNNHLENKIFEWDIFKIIGENHKISKIISINKLVKSKI